MKRWILVTALFSLCSVANLGAAAFEPTRTVTFEELRKAYPRAVIQDYPMRGVDVVILKLYIGSGAIRQNLHVFQKDGDGGLTFKTTIVLPARRSTITLLGDRLIIKCQGREMATLTRDFFTLYIPPSNDFPEEN